MKFLAGDPVVTVVRNPGGHNRLPRYLRGKAGHVQAVHGRFPLADERAAGRERLEPLYTVAFAADDIWGADAEPNGVLHAELWESYLARR